MNDTLLKWYVQFQCFMTRDEGQDLVEYALLVSLIALGMITGIKSIASAVDLAFSNVSNSLA